MAKNGINLVSQELVQNHLSQIIDSKHIQGFGQENDALKLGAAFVQDRSHYFWFLGGVLTGAFFGHRIGACSERARRFVENIEWMKAAAVNSYIGLKGIKLDRVEIPRLVEDKDVLIEVKAASMDFVDIKIAQGYGRGLRELWNKYNPNVLTSNFPVILGRDGTGIVKEVGESVEHLKPGDKVWFIVPPWCQGSLCQYINISSEYVDEMPKRLNFESGATLPYTGLVSWSLLVKSGGLGPFQSSQGKQVFLWGGVRAVERLCVQLCRVWGCQVTCVAPLYTHDYLRSLGASTLLEDDVKQIKKLILCGQRYDVVVNTACLLAEDLCVQLAKPDGRVVTSLASPASLPEYGLFTNMVARFLNSVMDILKDNLIGDERRWFETQYDGEILQYLRQLVDEGLIHPVGERIFSMEQVEFAFQCLAGGGHKGKLVIRMDQDQNMLPLQ